MLPTEEYNIQVRDETRWMIQLEMEKLKFYQVFFLPTGSGIVALVFAYKTLETGLLLSCFISGILFLAGLSIHRQRTIKKIDRLIKETQIQ